jgi:putative membrane protein
MIKIILKWLALAAAVLAAAYLIPGIGVASFQVALLVAVVLGFINIFIKPILGILTLPINFLTLGIFGLILNVLLFWAITLIVPGFTIAGFIPALLGSVVVAVIMWVVDIVL